MNIWELINAIFKTNKLRPQDFNRLFIKDYLICMNKLVKSTKVGNI